MRSGRRLEAANLLATPAGRATARLGPAVVALAAGCYCAGSLWRHPASRMISADWPDSIHYTWWMGWTAHALGRADNPLVTSVLNWPDGVSAMNNTTLLLPAALLSPVTALAGPLASLNLLNVLAVPLCALAAYWAARQLELIRPAAAAAGAAFAISPAVVNSLMGHVTMALAPGLPLLVGLSIRAWRGPTASGGPPSGAGSVRTGLLLGLVATAQLFTGEEILFQAAIGAGLVAAVLALSRPRAVPAAARRLAVSLASALAVFLPITAYPLYVQFAGPLRQHGSPFLQDYYAADLTSFVTPTYRVWLRSAASTARSATFPGGVEEHLAYLGWPLLITCAAVTLWRWRDLRVRAAACGLGVCAVLSLGGRIWVGGTQTEVGGPYRWLQAAPITEASLATRFALLCALFAAALLALAVDVVWRAPTGTAATEGEAAAGPSRWRGPAAAVALAAACLVPLLPRPVETMAAPAVPGWFTSAAAGGGASASDGSGLARRVVLVLPYPSPVSPNPMYWQSAAGYRFAMPGGYFLGPGADGHAYVGGGLDPPTAQLLQEVARTGVPAAVGPTERAQARRDLTAWGVGTIVLGPDPAAGALRQTVTALVGAGPEPVRGVDLWNAPFGLVE